MKMISTVFNKAQFRLRLKRVGREHVEKAYTLLAGEADTDVTVLDKDRVVLAFLILFMCKQRISPHPHVRFRTSP